MPQIRRSGVWTLVPVIAAAAIVIAAIFFLLREERRAEQAAMQSLAKGIAQDFHLDFENALIALRGVKAFWLGSEAVTEEEFFVYVTALEHSVHKFTAISWVDADNIVRYIHPHEGSNLLAVGLDHDDYANRRTALESARETRTASVTPPIILVQGFPGMIIFVPIFKGDEYMGSAVGVVRLSDLFSDVTEYVDIGKYDILLVNKDKLLKVDGATLYTTNGERVIEADGRTQADPSAPTPYGDEAGKVTLLFGDQTWELQIRERTSTITPELAVGAMGIFFVCMTVILFLVFFRQRREMEETNARERDFTALVSHQLRIPLTELSWMLETVFETSKDMTTEQAETIQEIRGIIRNSTGLINDLLDISKIERGILQMACEEVSIADLVRETAKVLERQAKEKGIALDIDIPEKMVVVADRQKAMEALRNVIDNAIKYAPNRTFIEIAAKESRDGVVISVSDHGAGIPADIQPMLFEKASMFTKKGTKEGSGLGLYLTKQFVELMGGTVRFETSSEGTTFFITLPKEASGQCEPVA